MAKEMQAYLLCGVNRTYHIMFPTNQNLCIEVLMGMRRKLKKSTKQYLTVACICIVVIGGAAILTSLLITNQIKEEYELKLKDAYHEMVSNQRKVYVAITDIEAGDFLTEDNIEVRTVYSSQPEEIYLNDSGEGKVALVDIPSGTQIINSMLTNNPVSSELREIEFNAISISSNIRDKDSVDVRISYPNGESFVVLSKKQIKGIFPETATCYFWLNEEEILRMSAAIVDAGLYSGASLNVTKYIEPSIQESSIVNYVPSLSILSLIESNPNIVEHYSQELNKEIRKALENRLAESMELDVSEIHWDINPNRLQTEILPKKPPSQNESRDMDLGQIEEKDLLSDRRDNEPMDGNEDHTTVDPNNVVDEESDYFYYSQEKEAKECEVELGE